ncbi:MAG: Fic/DOC family protein [Candidatus Ornithomonoglobus sp.]
MFSKYDVYTTTQSIYCYPDSNVLRNRLNIRDKDELSSVEHEVSFVRIIELAENPILGKFTKHHLMQIHKYIFHDIYRFAGHFRRENISKGTTQFLPHTLIERDLTKLFSQLKEEHLLSGLDKQAFAERLSYFMAELNVIHPFREGNGRATREFFRLLALHNNYLLNWNDVVPEALLDASILSVYDTSALQQCIVKCLHEL